ncbi:unnamed protein product [Periconia digitata]|uniref:Dol-P-Glc:Glc(2)Man(9)GlcNAc(2)-PP-Dol alpha-1,2-glucosyltransferase n=1 Tax=Periconia digitata TaxID=1303443 RepID=A0A9W4UP67_9PLEO|nr:unnamed protein product [Periconia digitata]
MPSITQAWALPAAFLAIVNISMTWYNLVSAIVPDPYLDEFFHVPQAKKYCRNDFSWDPKITTPPGLYLVSLLFKGAIGCETSNLRALNVVAICLICVLAYSISGAIHKNRSEHTNQAEKEVNSESDSKSLFDILTAHSALNISLFPPLFFFSALYYTDVMSTLTVLLHYLAFLNRKNASSQFLGSIGLILVGSLALLFRQTNIFWVAIFPAVIAVIDAFGGEQQAGSPEKKDLRSICARSWEYGRIYDCPVDSAGPQDFLLLTISLVIAVLAQPFSLLKVVAPYLFLVALFASFVLWNGSVVLGDKSAHTATLHLPQMLYIWPYISFFSIPLIVGSLLPHIAPLLPGGLSNFFQSKLGRGPGRILPNSVTASAFITIGLAMVHFNTIIHPYTLADNRHYVFYVFRVLLRHPAIKYAAVPVYYICAWMVFYSLGTKPESEALTSQTHQKKPSTSVHSPQSCKISFVVAWFGTTALSVATAPLVEPRYFIIPWILWRLHVPYLPGTRISGKARSYDLRLILETIWLIVLNAALGYNFLYRGFSWPQEPGNIQRFLW